MSNPLSNAGVQDFLWPLMGRDIQIRSVALGHAGSAHEDGHPETENVTHQQWMDAARIVDNYNLTVLGQAVPPWQLSIWPIPAGSQAGPISAPPPVVIPPPPPPAPPLPPRVGEPCPTCGHACPKQ